MELRQYQKRAVEATGKRSVLIRAECGAGKTYIAETIAERSGLVPLVLCPAAVRHQWRYDNVFSFEKIARDASVLTPLFSKDLILIIDEASRLKNARSKTSKAVMALRRHCRQVILLSALPAPNSLLEYYCCSYMVGRPFAESVFEFERRCAVLKRGNQILPATGYNRHQYLRQGFKLELNPAKEQAVLDRVKAFTVYIPESESAAEMPDVLFNRRFFEVDERKYKQVLKDSIIQLKDETIPLQHKMSQVMKLHQVESGFAYREDGTAERLNHKKLTALLEIIEEIGDERAIIFTRFTEEQRMIVERLESVTTDAETFKLGGHRFLVAPATSIGIGLNLQIAHISIFYSNDYSYENRLQALGRIRRTNQKKTCIYYDMISPGKLSEKILKVLENKQAIDEIVKGILD